jgi:hypothetical protein
MKKIIYKLLLSSIVSFFLFSCEEGERFSGSPEGNLEIVTLDATISSPTTFALTNQKMPFTVTLPRTFADTVKVEVTSISNRGRRTRAYVEVLPNQLQASEEINAAGGALFNTDFNMFISAIELYSVEKGKHYLIKSNTLVIESGNTTIPDVTTGRLTVKFTWPEIVSTGNVNNLGLVIDRPDPVSNAIINGFTSGESGKLHFINDLSTGTNSSTNSFNDGTYLFSVRPILLESSPKDFPYRIVLVYPDEKVEVYQGVLTGLTLNTLTQPFFKIEKIRNPDGSVTYTPTKL